MNLPLDISPKLFFRLLLPGSIVALAAFPLWHFLSLQLNMSFHDEFAFLLMAVLLGWLIITMDMHIYMLFEGRRYWPRKMYEIFLNFEKKRLDKLNKKWREGYSEETEVKKKIEILIGSPCLSDEQE